MSETKIPVYIDFKSPYAFLAVRPVRAMAIEYDVRLDWRPFNLTIGEFLGEVATRNDHQWRRVKYSYMDCRRLANQRGMTILGPQKVYDSTVACVGLLWAQRHGVETAFIDTVFERFFRRDLDIEDPDAIETVLAGCGADPQGFADWQAGDGREEFRRLSEHAMELGVFGVPSFLLDGELFWGGERLELLKERLRARAVPYR